MKADADIENIRLRTTGEACGNIMRYASLVRAADLEELVNSGKLVPDCTEAVTAIIALCRAIEKLRDQREQQPVEGKVEHVTA